MAELLLDRLALQELHVVDDKQVDAAKPLLEGERRLGLQRGDEPVHEAVGGEIDDALAARDHFMRDGLEEVRLAEADGRMNIQRVIERSGPRLDARYAFRGGVGQRVGPAEQEAGECQAAIERRSLDPVRVMGRRGVPVVLRYRRRHGLLDADGTPGDRRGSLMRACLDGSGDAHRASLHRAAYAQADFGYGRALLSDEAADAVHVMRLDPALQKPGWHGEVRDAVGDGDEFKPPEPAREDVLAELGAQPPADPRP